jgi:hypothetical protein
MRKGKTKRRMKRNLTQTPQRTITHSPHILLLLLLLLHSHE